ncbi:16641_t:CDS:2 [Cetraspora pellucida]|uniref:16641_t:CDS:1 n=1 Tax=Cetraspora pellucida TaxID=1433469 RepID=A0A9N9INF6_9GLOM|nr:16641_t:CDS:2 [Cetraspora pellucida]
MPNTVQPNIFTSGKISIRIRNQQSIGPRGYNQDLFKRTVFLSRLFLIPKKSGDLRPIQDGRNPVSKDTTKTKELHNKDRYKECFLSHPISLFVKVLLHIRISKFMLYIHGFTLWTYNKSQDLHQDSKTDNKAPESSENQINRLFRQHHNNGRVRKASYRAYQESELNQHVSQDSNEKNQRYHSGMQETEGYESSPHSQAGNLIRQDECYRESPFTRCSSKRPSDFWNMDRKNKTETHQLSETPSWWNYLNSIELSSRIDIVRMYQTPGESESRTYSRTTQHTSRPGITETEPPHSKLHFLETRPECLSHRCSSSSMEGLEYLGKPTMGPPTQSTTQGNQRKGDNRANIPIMANSFLVSNTIITSRRFPNSSPQELSRTNQQL